eukprot:6184600-Lingulodinium_polyedra.AAC.1
MACRRSSSRAALPTPARRPAAAACAPARWSPGSAGARQGTLHAAAPSLAAARCRRSTRAWPRQTRGRST